MTFHFRDLLKRSVAFVSQWFAARQPVDVLPEPATLIEPAKPAKVPRLKVDVDEMERNGSFYLRGAILDDLDRYMTYIRRMKRADPEAYALYSRIGAHVVPSRIQMSLDLNNWWKDKASRPSFGAVSLCGDYGDKDRVDVRFAYFQKLEKVAVDVQKSDGDVYRVTAYLDDKSLLKKWKRGVPLSFYIDIDDAGNLRLLKTFNPVRHHVGKTPKTTAQFIRFEWRYPEYPRGGSKRAAEVFSLFADAFYRANLSGFQVRATKDDDTAVFSIADNRAPYFFRDRDDAAGKKKIFHAVRSHKRDVDGKSVNVRMHYRGLRKFTWNGYDIVISVPGLHHAAMTDAKFGLLEPDAFDEKIEGVIDAGEVGQIMGSHLAGDQSKQRRAA